MKGLYKLQIPKKGTIPTSFFNTKDKNSEEKIPLKPYLYSAFILCFLGTILVIISQRNLPPEVPLFYGLPDGEEQLTSSAGLIIPSAATLGITVINVIICLFINNKFLQKTLILSSLALSLLAFITTVKIVLLISSF